jgi:hypothetical protein
MLSKSIAYIYYDDIEHLLIDYDNKTWGKFDEYEWKRKGAIVPGITSHNEDNINSYDIQYEILETLETYYYGNLWDRIEKLK